MGLSIPRIIFWIGIFVGLVALLLGLDSNSENVNGIYLVPNRDHCGRYQFYRKLLF